MTMHNISNFATMQVVKRTIFVLRFLLNAMPSEERQVLPSDLSKPTIFVTIFIISNTQREHVQTANNAASFKTSFTGNITKAWQVDCNTFCVHFPTLDTVKFV